MEHRISTVYLGLATDDSCSHAALAFNDGSFNMDTVIVCLLDGSVRRTGFTTNGGNSIQPQHQLLSQSINSNNYWNGNQQEDLILMSQFASTGGNSGGGRCPFVSQESTPMQVKYIVSAIKSYSHQESVKVLACGIDSDCSFADALCFALWNDVDMLPFTFSLKGAGLEERADSASRKCIMWFSPNQIPRLSISYRNQVEVDSGCIKLARLADYEASCFSRGETWRGLIELSDFVRDRNLRFAFFSATPQGGGVALMRHSLMRLFSLLNVNATWYVPKPNPEVFRITKHNHNLLQGIIKNDRYRFSDQYRQVYEQWVQHNCERYWIDGPFRWCDVIILDDPQVAAYVPFIKRANPTAKIVYRSHIEIRSDLIANPNSAQNHLWEYLWSFISKTDLFVSHPIRGFVPDSVPVSKVVYMPASTDLLDGLNKHLSLDDCLFWIHTFNRISFDQMGNCLKYPARPFCVQIARFDPSKGYHDVLASYLQLRQRMKRENICNERTPQLVLCGHGSVDDPDAAAVYSSLMTSLKTAEFDEYRKDICMARLPPEDRLLNALMRCARLALQLSHREGFEIKVTEALYKGTPIIVYKAGGIPLQLPPDYRFCVEVGNVKQVAELMYHLCVDDVLRQQTSDQIQKFSRRDELFSVWQAVNWLWIVKRLIEPPAADSETVNPCETIIDQEWKRWIREIHQNQ